MNLHLKNQSQNNNKKSNSQVELIDKLHTEWKDCLRCPLHVTRTQTVFGTGNTVNPKIFIVGQSPGEIEDREGKPFVGKDSWHLNAAMEKAGISRANDCYITNSVICRPWIPHTSRNFPPSVTSIESCRNRLLLEYEIVKNTIDVIVLVGKEAHITWLRHNDFSNPSFNSDMFKIRIKDVIGWNKSTSNLDETVNNKMIYTVYHPSYIARQGDTQLALDWLNDWIAISKFVFNKEIESPRGSNNNV